MKYSSAIPHSVEIDHPYIVEVLDEMFDGATSLLTENAVMYGGAVNSIIAGFPIEGDLDIAASKQEYMRLCKNFASSTKWVQIEGLSVREGGDSRPSSGLELKKSSRYSKELPIDKVVSFQGVNGAIVQMMQAKGMTGDSFEDALSIVRNVDFTCCGVAVDKYGNVLEVVRHGYSDSRDKIIRMANYRPDVELTRLKERMIKYAGRGWSLSISMDQALLNLKRVKEEIRRRKEKKKKKELGSLSETLIKKLRTNLFYIGLKNEPKTVKVSFRGWGYKNGYFKEGAGRGQDIEIFRGILINKFGLKYENIQETIQPGGYVFIQIINHTNSFSTYGNLLRVVAEALNMFTTHLAQQKEKSSYKKDPKSIHYYKGPSGSSITGGKSFSKYITNYS